MLSKVNVNVESSFDVSNAFVQVFSLVEESRRQYEGKRIDNRLFYDLQYCVNF